jgi:CubicO group peptidase (beta-lactamase class C family)
VEEHKLEAILAEHAARHSVPGAALGVLRDGTVVTGYYGVANVRTSEPVTAETRFSPGSLTKPMVATVIARLAEAGRLSLHDAIAARVPEVRHATWAQSATMKDLLANRSGVPLRVTSEFGFNAHTEVDDGALARLSSEGATGASPEDIWSYTNLGWCLLGRAIESSTGLTWEDAMRRYLFDPGRLAETTFVTQGEHVPRVGGHTVGPSGPVPTASMAARAYGPAGTSVLTTVTDMLRFAALHLKDPALAPLRASQAEVSINGWLDAWCLGWARFDWLEGSVWGWDGLIDGERSVLRVLPEHKAAVALMTNASTGRAMYRTLFADLIPDLFGMTVPPVGLDPSTAQERDLSRYAGSYGWPDRRVEITATTRGLVIEEDGEARLALPVDERIFLVDPADPDNPTVTFGKSDQAGRPNVLYDMLWGLPRLEP